MRRADECVRQHVCVLPGPCWAPTEIWPGIMLSHWGRRDFPHKSQTGYDPDDYSRRYVNPEWQPVDWREGIKGHPCFDPQKVCEGRPCDPVTQDKWLQAAR
jgi:hypothetical protein